jgi:integrase
MTTKLTNRIIAKELPVPATGNKITYDTEVKGFGIRITAGGNRSFILNYRRRDDGRERRYTIGAFPTWEAGPAREEARRLRRVIDGGGDPVGELQETRAAPTVADLCARFEEEHLPRKRAWTRQSYKQAIKTHVLPALGSLKVAAVTYADTDKLHRDISKRAPTQANRVLAILSKMFNLAIKWGMRADNPCKGVERNHEEKRKRYMVGDELQRLTAALAAYDNQQAANAIRLLLLTGARKTEVLSAKWSQFDVDSGIWTKPGSTTKQKTEHVVPLSAPALELLRDLYKARRGGSEYVFPSTRADDGCQHDITGAWRSICRDAGITGLRVHDLRHHFASVLASSGHSLPIIGQLLGHSQPATTARYAHLFDDAIKSATEKAGAIIAGGVHDAR